MEAQEKFIFVTGGVLSGLGKGITAASIGNLLKNRGLKVNLQKLDPYLNVDAGTLNPIEHGECFVTCDGAETDLDLGHYERFVDVELSRDSSVMSGRLLRQLIDDERSGKFLGQTVQLVPHFTNLIKEKVRASAKGFDVHIVEVGGTVGDYESPAFFEAIRQISDQLGESNCLNVQVVYLPFLGASNEVKTKPAQNAVRELRALGIVPQVIVARSEKSPNSDVKAKISSLAGVKKSDIALLPNASTIYEVPVSLEEQGIGEVIVEKLGLGKKAIQVDNQQWLNLLLKAKTKFDKTIKVGMVAKYLDNGDAYMSVVEAVAAAGFAADVNTEIIWIDAEQLNESNLQEQLGTINAMIVPGGFGERGMEGKVLAAGFAADKNIPYLGICLGLQAAAIAAARRAGLKKANSLEMDPKTPDPVVYIMQDQKGQEATGGTMRLGDYDCYLKKKSLAHKVYGKEKVVERHRHRYEINNDYRTTLEKAGLIVSGTSKDDKLVEVVEIPELDYFIATQAHPEFKSRPTRAHPLFEGLIKAAKKSL